MATTTHATESARLLAPGEVARLFAVDVKTVTRWANTGRLPAIRTPSGQRRFREDQVLAFLTPTGDRSPQADGDLPA